MSFIYLLLGLYSGICIYASICGADLHRSDPIIARVRMRFSMVNIRANCNNILTAYPDARSLSFACRRLQFNKLRFYLYDNMPVDFIVVVEDLWPDRCHDL